MYYVYCICDEHKKLYIGYTQDVDKRVKEHNMGWNKSTKGKMWKLVYYEAYLSKSDAKRREQRLKQRGQAKRFLKDRIQESIEEAMLS